MEGKRDGSVGKEVAANTKDLSLIPWTHMVSSGTHACFGMCMHMYKYTHINE